MEREIDLKKISDGKLYTNKGMVKAGCGECQGCSDCCRGMGNSIFLDPMDIYRLTTGLECTFEDLLSTCVELQVVDGFIQPNMKMTGKEEQCPFLNEKGRCNIHAIRPGICRLFPLGRCYDGEGGFQYFLQIYECKKEPKSKVKIKNWLGVEEIGRYENFVAQWHYFQKDAQKVLGEISQEALVKKLHLYLLTLFYQKPYDGKRDFYNQFEQRLQEAKQQIGIAG